MSDESVTLPKDLYVLNLLGMGVAIQFLANITGEEIEAWKQHIGAIATEQYKSLSPLEIQRIIDNVKVPRTACQNDKF
ncbi:MULTISPECIES: hypothetical protein [Calothrix]|uniref:Uncharacterized protein n=2 Tax=Calothrix TaxID=1186 RepID=A0ABR8ADV2_9CYAN|nr:MULTISPECIES: hypothetical protein [Calothrix]MBD2197929.1 hypothetical protein [Calothrix parietina FACHB-288]MBD2226786.1 hypothetical protein [Calothrix anomala FACHB-343]